MDQERILKQEQFKRRETTGDDTLGQNRVRWKEPGSLDGLGSRNTYLLMV